MPSLSPDIIRVRLEHLDLVHGVVIVDPDQHVIGTRNDPLLACDELGCPHWQLADLERLDERLNTRRYDEDIIHPDQRLRSDRLA